MSRLRVTTVQQQLPPRRPALAREAQRLIGPRMQAALRRKIPDARVRAWVFAQFVHAAGVIQDQRRRARP